MRGSDAQPCQSVIVCLCVSVLRFNTDGLYLQCRLLPPSFLQLLRMPEAECS
jgi:hypothetical protein